MQEERYLKCCIRVIGKTQIDHIAKDYFCSKFDTFDEIYNCEEGTILAVKSNPDMMPYLMTVINKDNKHETRCILIKDVKSNHKMILCEDEFTLSTMNIYLVNRVKELSGNLVHKKVSAKHYEVKKHIETYDAIYFIDYNYLYDIVKVGDKVLMKNIMSNEYEVMTVSSKNEDMFLDEPRKLIILHGTLGLHYTVIIINGKLTNNGIELLLVVQDDYKENKNGN